MIRISISSQREITQFSLSWTSFSASFDTSKTTELSIGNIRSKFKVKKLDGKIRNWDSRILLWSGRKSLCYICMYMYMTWNFNSGILIIFLVLSCSCLLHYKAIKFWEIVLFLICLQCCSENNIFFIKNRMLFCRCDTQYRAGRIPWEWNIGFSLYWSWEDILDRKWLWKYHKSFWSQDLLHNRERRVCKNW